MKESWKDWEEKSTETVKEEWNKQTCYNELETNSLGRKENLWTNKKEIGYHYGLKFWTSGAIVL